MKEQTAAELAKAKKEAFFWDWKDVARENATGFQDGWDKGWNAALDYARLTQTACDQRRVIK